MDVTTKASDRCYVSLAAYEHHGYVPDKLNIGGGDYLELEICADCGHLEGEWPIPLGKAAEVLNGEE